MEYPNESKAMTEIRKIREELSQKMKDMTPEEWVSHVKKEAEAFEKEFGLDLPRYKPEPVGTK